MTAPTLAPYQRATQRLADSSGRALSASYDALTRGDLSEQEFLDLGAGQLTAANAKATAMADDAVASYWSAVRGEPTPTLGLGVEPGTTKRLHNGIKVTIRRPNPPMRVARIGRAEPLDAGQRASLRAMRAHRVGGWTRVTTGEACPLCTGLADGSVYPPTTSMITHPGCDCIAEPVT
jgi:hypothetical protein